MKSLSEMYTKVSEWNSKRYPREYSKKLSIELITEEVRELLESESPVEFIDALADIVFVTLGIVWKLDCKSEIIHTVAEQTREDSMFVLEYSDVNVAYPAAVNLIEQSEEHYVLYNSLMLCSIAMWHILKIVDGDQDKMWEILSAIVDSNNTKSVNMTDKDSKYVNGKGEFYVPPTIALNKILNRGLH